jgi:hypothetical protein
MSTTRASDGLRLQVAPKPRPAPSFRADLIEHIKTAPLERKGSSTYGLKTVNPQNHPGDPLQSPMDEWQKDKQAFHLSDPPRYPEGQQPRKVEAIFIGAG